MKKKLIWIILIYCAVFTLLVGLAPRNISWNDSFESSSEQPYGLYITSELIKDIFSDVEEKDVSLYKLKSDTTGQENYIFITSFFGLQEDERNNLLEWVAAGNNAFIAAKDFSYELLDTLNLDPTYIYKGIEALDQSSLKVQSIQSEYRFAFAKQFNIYGLKNKVDTLEGAFPLAVSKSEDEYDDNLPIVVQRNFGEGKIILSTLPYSFTNYYMLYEENYKFAQDILSFLPDVKTHWDVYYKPQMSRQPPLKVFLNTKAFRWAGILGLTLLLLHMIFSIKRTQRIIPIVNPPENRSLEFTKTIGDLYHSTYDLHDLMRKIERHFKEYVREKYRITNYLGTPEQTEVLLAKSGKKIGLISSINTYFKDYRNLHIVDENSILRLSKKLQQFYDER